MRALSHWARNSQSQAQQIAPLIRFCQAPRSISRVREPIPTLPPYFFAEVMDDLKGLEPTIKILFVTPEKVAKSDALMRVLDDLHRRSLLARVVVDEAHCVSQWGHDFRPDYMRLSVFKLRCNISLLQCRDRFPLP